MVNETIERYLEENKVSGASVATLRNKKCKLYLVNSWKPLESWIKADVTAYINMLSTSGEYKDSSVDCFKREIKAFFNWLGKPEYVSHVHSKIIRNGLKRDEILTLQDIYAMMDCTESPMYRALCIFLYESGGRSEEVLSVRVCDIEETKSGMMITLHQTKWGNRERKDVYLYSASYIRNLIAYLNLGKNDYLFKSPYEGKGHISNWQGNMVVKELAEKAGINKPVTLHKFRHALATEMTLHGYPESIICQKFGWVLNSDAALQYKHLDDNDVIKEKLKRAGKVVDNQLPPTVIKEAPKLEIADPMSIIKKQQADMENLKAEILLMKEAFGMVTAPDGKISFQANIRELPQQIQQKKKGIVGIVSSEKLADDAQ